MKKVLLILLILAIIVGISGCTQTSSNKTYSGNGISFIYPGNWSELNTSSFQNTIGDAGTLLVVVGDEKKERFGVSTVNIGTNQVLRTPNQWAAAMNTSSGFDYVTGKTTTIDGVEGYQLTMKDSSNNFFYYYIYWVKNEKGYLAVLVSQSDAQALFESIIQTIKTT